MVLVVELQPFDGSVCVSGVLWCGLQLAHAGLEFVPVEVTIQDASTQRSTQNPETLNPRFWKLGADPARLPSEVPCIGQGLGSRVTGLCAKLYLSNSCAGYRFLRWFPQVTTLVNCRGSLYGSLAR